MMVAILHTSWLGKVVFSWYSTFHKVNDSMIILEKADLEKIKE